MTQIKITPGHCGVCEAVISSGLFCSSCLPTPIAKNTTPPVTTQDSNQLKAIHKMKRGEEGYVSQDAIFVVDDDLWIINNYPVSESPIIDDMTVLIYRDDEGDFLVEYFSLDWDNISEGWPPRIKDKWISPLTIFNLDDIDDDDDIDDYNYHGDF